MKQFTIYLLISLVAVCLCVSAIAKDIEAPAEPAGEKWIDITEKVFANPADKPGWEKDEQAKIFRDEPGNLLKITTSQFGVLMVDLATTTVYKIDETGKTEIPDIKMFQRDHGRSLVIRNDTFKLRCRISEKVKAMVNIPGIKAM